MKAGPVRVDPLVHRREQRSEHAAHALLLRPARGHRHRTCACTRSRRSSTSSTTAPAATGMTYRNGVNPTGVTIDGNPDALDRRRADVGAGDRPAGDDQPGRHRADHRLHADVATNYYLDDSTPPVTQCTGDAFAYGSSGTVRSLEHASQHRPGDGRHRVAHRHPDHVLREPGRDRERRRRPAATRSSRRSRRR